MQVIKILMIKLAIFAKNINIIFYDLQPEDNNARLSLITLPINT